MADFWRCYGCGAGYQYYARSYLKDIEYRGRTLTVCHNHSLCERRAKAHVDKEITLTQESKS